jgi:hypothetical protein
MLKDGTCKLCQLEKPLLNESHIIPEFMYESLFDNGHKFNKLVPAELIKGKGRISRPSTGEYEGGLLCADCDNIIIGGYETYARNALYAKEEGISDLPECTNFITNGGVKFTRCRNVYYKEFKLFLLSVLWRASISSREFFKEVNLGPYEETIRQMIYNGDPKEADVFPILMMTWINDKFFPTDLVGQPGINRKENGIRYIFIIAGITYVFHISPTSLRHDLKEFCLLPSNEVSLLYIPEGKSRKLFSTYFRTKKKP